MSGDEAMSIDKARQTPELTLLLTVARVLRADITSRLAWNGGDVDALDKALAPWSALPGEPVNECDARLSPAPVGDLPRIRRQPAGVDGNYGFAHDPRDQIRDDAREEGRAAAERISAKVYGDPNRRSPAPVGGDAVEAARKTLNHAIREAARAREAEFSKMFRPRPTPTPPPAEPDGGDAVKAYHYAARLFGYLAPQCEPLDDLMGVLTQIDNATTVIPTLRKNVADLEQRLAEAERQATTAMNTLNLHRGDTLSLSNDLELMVEQRDDAERDLAEARKRIAAAVAKLDWDRRQNPLYRHDLREIIAILTGQGPYEEFLDIDSLLTPATDKGA